MPDLKFLGRGAAFFPVFGNTNAYFEAGDDLFFLDFGESAFEKVYRRFNLTRYRRIYVLVTHLHADHAGSLASLISYTHCVLKTRITVVHPLDTVVRLLALAGISDTFYQYLPALPDGCSVRARAVEVPHAADMRAFGYLLSFGGETVYYSGDAAALPSEVYEAFMQGKIARVYQDTASHESSAHCWYKRLEQLIPPERRAAVHCMHLDGDYADTLKSLGFSVVETEEA